MIIAYRSSISKSRRGINGHRYTARLESAPFGLFRYRTLRRELSRSFDRWQDARRWERRERKIAYIRFTLRLQLRRLARTLTRE